MNQSATSPDQQAKDEQDKERREAHEKQRREELEKAPFVALSLQTSGIHPSTSRIITVDVVTLDPSNNPVETFHAVVNPDGDPGPFHLHGVHKQDVEQAKNFSHVLKSLDRLIDGRTLIVHNAPRMWGFIVAEAKRAMNDAARANRSGNRSNRRGGRGRRRQRVGHVPRPQAIVDTLSSARRQGVTLDDVRVRGAARTLGLNAPQARASVERAQLPASQLCREDSLLIATMYFQLRESGPVATLTPEEVRADRFGLQRSHIRVEAQDAIKPLINPGAYEPGKSLIAGMEVVVAPQIEMDPDIIIQAVADQGLAYSEKLTRQTSVVVCNQTRDIDGKAMHAQRKGIPLLSDVAFMRAVERVKAGKPAEKVAGKA